MTDPPRESSSFFEQLKRRRVIRVGIAYGAAVFDRADTTAIRETAGRARGYGPHSHDRSGNRRWP
jgi:hypothetical protein